MRTVRKRVISLLERDQSCSVDFVTYALLLLGSYSYGKEFAPFWEQFFPLRVAFYEKRGKYLYF